MGGASSKHDPSQQEAKAVTTAPPLPRREGTNDISDSQDTSRDEHDMSAGNVVQVRAKRTGNGQSITGSQRLSAPAVSLIPRPPPRPPSGPSSARRGPPQRNAAPTRTVQPRVVAGPGVAVVREQAGSNTQSEALGRLEADALRSAYSERVHAALQSTMVHKTVASLGEAITQDLQFILQGSSPLLVAAAEGSVEALEVLVGLEADAVEGSWSGLAAAVSRGHPSTGASPLHAGAAGGHAYVVALLAQQLGADLEGRTAQHGLTPLMAVCGCLHEGVEELNGEGAALMLLDAGAEVDARDSQGCTALFYAAALGKGETVAALTTARAAIGVQDENNVTALHVAAACSRPMVIEVLLRAGADVQAHDITGLSPIDLASMSCDEETSQALELRGHTLKSSLRPPGSDVRAEQIAGSWEDYDQSTLDLLAMDGIRPPTRCQALGSPPNAAQVYNREELQAAEERAEEAEERAGRLGKELKALRDKNKKQAAELQKLRSEQARLKETVEEQRVAAEQAAKAANTDREAREAELESNLQAADAKAANEVKQLQSKLKALEASSTKSIQEAKRRRLEAEKQVEQLQQELTSRAADQEELTRVRQEAQEAQTTAQKAVQRMEQQRDGALAAEAQCTQLEEMYRKEALERKKLHNTVQDLKGQVRVYCRVRPMSSTELKEKGKVAVGLPDEYTVVIDTPKDKRTPSREFQFDRCFGPQCSQAVVYEEVQGIVQSSLDGYNTCIFCYGQTGTGKTFTMYGGKTQETRGLVPRILQEVFAQCQAIEGSCSVHISVLELYRDSLRDLAGDGGDSLRILQDARGIIKVPEAGCIEVASAKEADVILQQALQQRCVGATKMNAESSRSHLIVEVTIERDFGARGCVTAKLSLVDLAGSERVKKSGVQGDAMKEAQAINTSLTSLVNVIEMLSQGEKNRVPYRDHKLTLLMSNSLGGNSKTLMIVNLSPSESNAEESVSSLRYAARAKMITNDAQKNQEGQEVRRLKQVIKKMSAQLNSNG